MSHDFSEIPLGRTIPTVDSYTPSLLYPIPRWDARELLELDDETMPFRGVDIWNAYELSWLDERGKPEVALAQIVVPANSRFLIESKSLKLYLNSLNNTCFKHRTEVIRTLEQDLSQVAHAPVLVHLASPQEVVGTAIAELPGTCLDALPLEIHDYRPDPALLQLASTATGTVLTETLYTHLFRSNCPVTHQPDWASVLVRYHGPAIEHESLLRYLVGYRNHADFHEQCVERIFVDIWRRCQPAQLSVYARFTRRGGLDINPFRTNFEEPLGNLRLFRQ